VLLTALVSGYLQTAQQRVNSINC